MLRNKNVRSVEDSELENSMEIYCIVKKNHGRRNTLEENNAIGEDILKNMLRKKWKEDDARN